MVFVWTSSSNDASSISHYALELVPCFSNLKQAGVTSRVYEY